MTEHKKKKRSVPMMLIIAGGFAMMLLTVGAWVTYSSVLRAKGLEDMEAGKSYEYHYTMITSSSNSPFWEAVYESAKQRAEENDALLELMSNESFTQYEVTDFMDMSIAASVDGIILEYTGEPHLLEQIREAVNKGIPVVTLMGDAVDSGRQSFIGVSNYQMSQVYSEQILSLVTSDTRKIMVLTDGGTENNNQRSLFALLNNALIQSQLLGDVIIEEYLVDARSTFESEEAIHNIFMSASVLPDILVCLDEIDTECAYHAVVDYNQVGKVKIVGYYASKSILDGVKKGIISSIVDLDTKQLGEYSIDALSDYKKEGRANDYYNVNVNVIDADNVQDFMERENEKQ